MIITGAQLFMSWAFKVKSTFYNNKCSVLHNVAITLNNRTIVVIFPLCNKTCSESEN